MFYFAMSPEHPEAPNDYSSENYIGKNINLDIIYAGAAYHDIGISVDLDDRQKLRDNHHLYSSKIVLIPISAFELSRPALVTKYPVSGLLEEAACI